MQRRITQEDIARRLGVDKSTVSLALRRDPRVAKSTRQRIEAMAEELGYRPDPALATLARQRWAGHETGSGAALAYLVDSRSENVVLQRRFMVSARTRAIERGYHLEEMDLARYPDVAAVARVLRNRGIRGLLVPYPSRERTPGVLDIPTNGFTVVCFDVGWSEVPFHIVTWDIFHATQMVWREAVARGYERIGGAILAHTPRAIDDSTRLGASLASQEEMIPHGTRLPLLTSGPLDREGFLRWVEHHRPDAIVASISRVYIWLQEAGWRVPGDTSFACLKVVTSDMSQFAGCLADDRHVGRAGVDALIAAMTEDEWGVPAVQRKLLIEPIWNEGRTLPRRSAPGVPGHNDIVS